MHAANAAAGPALAFEEQGNARRELLFDPQTSGGLLIGISTARAQALRDALREAGYSQAEIIGEVVARDPAEGLPAVLVQS